MAKKKLTNEQRDQILQWLAAGYATRVIQGKIEAQNAAEPGSPGAGLAPWPEITQQTMSYYRVTYGPTIEQLAADRHERALAQGLAAKAERIARLAALADELESILWQPDKNGRLWNIKAWRETLADIAAEMGHRRQGIDVTIERELDQLLTVLQENLDESTYARILAAIAGRQTAAE